MDVVLLAAIIGLPFVVSGTCARLGLTDARRAALVSSGAAFVLALLAWLAPVDSTLPLLSNRELHLTPIAQFGIQLEALALLGLFPPASSAFARRMAPWLPVAWLSVGGMSLALLLSSLSLGLLAFVASAALWAFGLPVEDRGAAAGSVLRYAALLALVTPLLLLAFALAEGRSGSATPDLEVLAIALAAPGYGLILGIVPMHAWTLTLASGAPREMLLGVLTLVQTTAVVMLLRTLEAFPWITAVAGTPLVVGGTLSVLVGAWLAFSAPLEDPDDWLAYAAVAHGGMLLVGLGTQSLAATVGVLLLLFSRVLALVTLAAARRARGRLRRLGHAAATLTLAGTPGLAGFPGLWLIVRRAPLVASFGTQAALLLGSGLLFATAVRRWRGPTAFGEASDVPEDGAARRTIWVLVAMLVVLGLAPQLVAAPFERALRGMFIAAP